MRGVRRWAGAVAGVVTLSIAGLTTPALAGMAAIEAAAALPDQSEASVKAAVDQALSTAMQGAKAMGLPRIELRSARVLKGAVTVLIIAKDTEHDPLEELFGTEHDADEAETPKERSTL